MKLLGVLITILLALLSVYDSEAWPVSNPEMLNALNMQKIPQFHCLRYFKHDVHLLRRCRNIRLLRRPLVEDPEDPEN